MASVSFLVSSTSPLLFSSSITSSIFVVRTLIASERVMAVRASSTSSSPLTLITLLLHRRHQIWPFISKSGLLQTGQWSASILAPLLRASAILRIYSFSSEAITPPTFNANLSIKMLWVLLPDSGNVSLEESEGGWDRSLQDEAFIDEDVFENAFRMKVEDYICPEQELLQLLRR